MNTVVKFMGVLIVPVGILLYIQQLNHGIPFKEAVVGTVTSVVGMIPCGLYLLTSIALTVSVIHLAEKRTLVREMYSIEALARTDVLCLDKTGTLTSGEMNLYQTIELVEGFSTKFSSFLAAFDSHDPTSDILRNAYGAHCGETAEDKISFNSDRKMERVPFFRRLVCDGCL